MTVPTHIHWQLTKSYGVRGKITKKGMVQAWQNDTLLTQTMSDDEGYFLLDDLPAGQYTLKADAHKTQTIAITDDYVFGVVLQGIDTTSSPSK